MIQMLRPAMLFTASCNSKRAARARLPVPDGSLKIAQSFSSGLIPKEKSKSHRDERNAVPSLTGLTKLTDVSPSHKWLGYFRGDVQTCFCWRTSKPRGNILARLN